MADEIFHIIADIFVAIFTHLHWKVIVSILAITITLAVLAYIYLA